MLRGRTVLTLLAAGVIAACASSGSKPNIGSGGNGGSIGSDAGGAAGNGGSGGVSGSGGSTPDATAPDSGGDTGQPEASPPDGNSDATAPDASPDTGPEASPEAGTCQATGTAQCGTGLVCAPGDRCHSLYTGTGIRDWPIDANATGPASDAGGNSCTDSKGNTWPSEGVGSATWFGFIDCGSYKTFPVSAGCAFDILSYIDCCQACVLNDVNIAVQEQINGVWTTQTTITHPYTGQCEHWDDIYVPKTSQVRLQYVGSGGSYLCVFQQ